MTYDQFEWWYKEDFAKNMKSNRTWSSKFNSEEEEKKTKIIADWTAIQTSDKTNQTGVAANGRMFAAAGKATE